MDNFVAFFRMVFSYGFVYIIFIACIVASTFAGIGLRKSQNKKKQLSGEDSAN